MTEKNKKISSENIFIGVFVLIIVVVTSVYMIKSKNDTIEFKKNNLETLSAQSEVYEEKEQEIDNQTKILDEEIKIYVVGEVVNPGVVTIKKGQIIEDAIKMAGGFTEKADVDNVNLVYKLTKNVMIKINSKDENNTSVESQKKPMEIISESLVIVDEKVDENANKIVDINSATIEKLTTLPGIGESFAKRIIQFREKNGGFKIKEDLKKVSGIGNAKYDAIKDLIEVN